MDFFDKNSQTFFFPCVHCGEMIAIHVSDICCRIFRHGNYKNGLHSINPHASREVCEDLVKNDLIYGCGKPFRMERGENGFERIVECEYI